MTSKRNPRPRLVPFLSCLLALTVLTTAFGQAPADQAKEADSPKAELWFGTLRVEDVRQFRFLVELKPKGDEWSGVLISFDEGSQRFELSEVQRDETTFSFVLPKTRATYIGKPSEDGKTIAGKWKQGGNLTLDFERVAEAPKQKIKTTWKGTINAIIQKLDVAIIELESGELFFESLAQKAGGFVTKDESTDDEVIYKVPAVRGTFKGKYSEDKTEISGTWSQGLPRFKLVLKKVDASEIKPKAARRPQTPKAPFPYEIREVTFPSKEKGVTLAGTLTRPRGKAKGAVVLISGSGPQDRDETILEHKPFWVIADHFARNGIATLRFDDRGTAQSDGDFATATSFNFADDAEGALTYLRDVPELKGIPVGLCGHSEGGLIAPIVAARNDHADFIVLMAGPGVNGEEILYNQAGLIMAAEGASESDIKENTVFQRVLFTTITQHPDAFHEELEAKVGEALKESFSEEALAKDDLGEKIKAGVAQIASPWMRTFLVHEPSEPLSKVQCPVLVVIGEKDLQVDPKLNLPAIRKALKSGGNEHFEIVEYPNLNHLFQSCKTGSVSEYQGIEETFNAKPLAKMTEWILGL